MFAGQQVGSAVGAFTFAFHFSISFRTLDILSINFPFSCLFLLTTQFMANSPLWVLRATIAQNNNNSTETRQDKKKARKTIRAICYG